MTALNKAPYWHEWTLVEPGLWHCEWCDGWYKSEQKPNCNAIANSRAAINYRNAREPQSRQSEE